MLFPSPSTKTRNKLSIFFQVSSVVMKLVLGNFQVSEELAMSDVLAGHQFEGSYEVYLTHRLPWTWFLFLLFIELCMTFYCLQPRVIGSSRTWEELQVESVSKHCHLPSSRSWRLRIAACTAFVHIFLYVTCRGCACDWVNFLKNLNYCFCSCPWAEATPSWKSG